MSAIFPGEPPIYLKPAFIAEPQALFVQLRDSIDWDERMRARKTACFGVAYDYSQITYPVLPMLDLLAPICSALEIELGFRPNNCLLNYYPDGNASMGFHSDSSMELATDTGVAIVSLGAVRSLVYRYKEDHSQEFAYPLPNGSLLYMSQQMQQDWLHAIPKDIEAGERISLTFRQIRQ